MPPNRHARLSPSASQRWLSCPASVRLIAALPEQDEEDSVYAQEGTLAHALAEIKAGLRFGKITKRQHTIRRNKWLKEAAAFGLEPDSDDMLEMERHTDAYVEFLAARLEAHPHSVIMLEQRLDSGLPECTGTSDAVIYSPTHVEIVDLKYGAGVQVLATENSQLRLYGLGALDTYGDVLGETETVTTTVFQPRIGDGHAHSETLTADELRDWRREVQPIAMSALGPDAPFGPSEEACRWCPMSGICRAQMQATFGVIEDDLERDPDLLTHEEIGGLLAVLPHVQEWAKAVHEAAMRIMHDEEQVIPGWKVVRGNGRRQIKDEQAAIDALRDAGYDDAEITRTTLRTLGVLDKVTSGTLGDVLGDLLTKSEGRPAIVEDSDPRQPINRNAAAVAAFTEDEDLL